jgi:pyruvate,water dikinase
LAKKWNRKSKIITDIRKMNDFKQGDILVTKMTDLTGIYLMAMASAIYYRRRGEKLPFCDYFSGTGSVPCIVATKKCYPEIKNGMEITVDCSQGGKGYIYDKKIDFEVKKYNLAKIPELKVKIMANVGTPKQLLKILSCSIGVGLAREEFIIAIR